MGYEKLLRTTEIMEVMEALILGVALNTMNFAKCSDFSQILNFP